MTSLRLASRMRLGRSMFFRPRLSVVVCTYNRYDLLRNAIHSLLRQRLDPGFLEVIVVDNSPDQDNAARFAARFADAPGMRYLLEPTPGLSHARNVGVAHARAERVAFMDDDAVAAVDWAAHIVRGFEAFAGRAGVVGGRVLPRWVSPRPEWLGDNVLGYLSILDRGAEMRPLEPTEWLVGCNIAYDKRVLLSVGGFSRSLGRIGSEATLLSNEELEVADKIHRAGRLSIYCPEAVVHHIMDPTRLTRAWFRRRAAWQAVSDFIKNPHGMAAQAPTVVEHLRRELHDGSRPSTACSFGATEDPQEFERDVVRMYYLVLSMLTGGEEEMDGTGRLHREEACAQLGGS